MTFLLTPTRSAEEQPTLTGDRMVRSAERTVWETGEEITLPYGEQDVRATYRFPSDVALTDVRPTTSASRPRAVDSSRQGSRAFGSPLERSSPDCGRPQRRYTFRSKGELGAHSGIAGTPPITYDWRKKAIPEPATDRIQSSSIRCTRGWSARWLSSGRVTSARR